MIFGQYLTIDRFAQMFSFLSSSVVITRFRVARVMNFMAVSNLGLLYSGMPLYQSEIQSINIFMLFSLANVLEFES